MYEELKKLAKASAGEWYVVGELRYEDRRTGDLHGLHHDDERFIAAANPSAVLALIAENEKIRGLLAEKLIGQTMLTGIIPEDGGMTIGLEGGACAIMADVFGEQLFTSQAENYIELSFASGKYPDLGQIVVTVKREIGKTPHQLRVTAEQERDQLKAENEALRKDLESHKRMLLAAAIDIGSIGEALGAEMDDDASELAGLATDLCQDAARLNWLDARMSPVIENQSYAQPEGELAGYNWNIFGQCGSVREAIDDAMSKDVDQ